ncbi:putative FtsK gamma domain-containing protein [Paraburkholderia kururiensis]|uniref:DNA translocase FtsK n=1 Tax=Paraburkholderia kururiensis TaxID=984307 RepID=UPI0039A4BD4C
MNEPMRQPEQQSAVSDAEFTSAKQLFNAKREVSVGLLQRHFRLTYPDACNLMVRLEGAGLVTPKLPEGFRVLTPEHSNHRAPRTPGDIELYARSVFETALYLLEMKTSDGGGGHSEAFKEIKPSNVLDWRACRRVLPMISSNLEDGPSSPHARLFDVCRWVAELTGDGCTAAPYRFAEVENMLHEMCEWWAPYALARSTYDSLTDFGYATGLMASARYLYRIFLEGQKLGGGHSRLEYFVRQGLRETGSSRKWQAKAATVVDMSGYQQNEHVVPCVFIRDNCIRLYGLGASIAQVAEYIGRHTVIVRLLKEESRMLDASAQNGGLGLKTTMPEGWRVGVDSVFARLHAANIEFDPPPWFEDNIAAPR